MKKIRTLFIAGLAFTVAACTVNIQAQTAQKQKYREKHRPQFHYTPERNWMNDPNGMVFFDGEYHLFYQHDDMDKVFGNMSWGHAISTDLVHWKEYPKAIVPDSDGLGLIFSGSTVVDKNNTAGFGANALVAIYTSTRPGQQQCMAYSTDKGRTWTKYSGNPVIKNERDDTIPDDFRDPKVMWHKVSGRWIMSLAVQDHVEFWSSGNLKNWVKESEFGQGLGAHSGVWECPDLFQLPVDGNEQNKKWVLLVSINPGGPNSGSATQYFVGDFDGNKFVLDQQFKEKLSTKAVIPDGKVFAGFELNNYENWQVEGDAFGQAPARGSLGNQQKVNDFEGKGLVNSFLNGDSTTGKLISPAFTIETDYINLLVGGGKNEGVAVNLVTDNQVIRTATGNNSESLTWKYWNTKDLKGKIARIEIVDQEKGGWGHILADQIMFADSPAVNRKEGRWVDYGTDNYAGVTWSNVENRAIAIGWMSNWEYAGKVPTSNWKGATTFPREIRLKTVGSDLYLTSGPVKEINKILTGTKSMKHVDVKGTLDLSERLKGFTSQFRLKLTGEQLTDYSIVLSNDLGEELVIGYDKRTNEYFVDRSKSQHVEFDKGFSARHASPRLAKADSTDLTLLVDAASVEVFADSGLNVMTEIFFPGKKMNKVTFRSANGFTIKELSYSKIESIWK